MEISEVKRGVEKVRGRGGTKGATALLCADATCLGSRTGNEDEWVLNYNKNLPFAWCLICPDLWVLCGNYPTKRKLITLITLVAGKVKGKRGTEGERRCA